MAKNMTPYSVYLPDAIHKKLKELSKRRMAAMMVREAITAMLEGGDLWRAGYNKGLEDAAGMVSNSKEASMISVDNQKLSKMIVDNIMDLRLK